MTSPNTQAALNEIINAVAMGQTRIVPMFFSHQFGRAATSAAFRMAIARDIIEVAYIGGSNNPVYQGKGIAEAMEEAKLSQKH